MDRSMNRHGSEIFIREMGLRWILLKLKPALQMDLPGVFA